MLALLLIAAMPVALDGPTDAVHDVTTALVERGIRVEPAGLPPGEESTLAVELQELDGAYQVSIHDPWGRSAERDVKDLLTAVAWIESWSRMELIEEPAPTATSTEAKTKPEKIEPARSEPVRPAKRKAAVREPPPEEPRSSTLFRVVGQAAAGDHDEHWLGAGISACERVGFACFGVSARYLRSELGSQAVDVLVDLDAPLTMGPLTLTLGVGLGAGWSQLAPDGQLLVRPDRFRRPVESFGEEAILPRAEAHATLSLHLFDNLNVAAGAAATTSPFFNENHGELADRNTLMSVHVGLLWGLP